MRHDVNEGRTVAACAELNLARGENLKNRRAEILAWDGRLDNREDLLLRLRGSLRTDPCGQSLALAAYERWGTDGFVHLIGDWSVVIRDIASQRIVLASDYAGVRPLYYSLQPERIVWSTRLQPLVEVTGIEELDEKFIAGFLTIGGCPNRTPYKGIYSVPPGYALCVSAKEMTIHPFWKLPTGGSTRYQNERQYEDQLRTLFQEAVAVRLQTDAPVLAELSGGLDSSSVVCMANQLIRGGRVNAPRLVSVSYVWPDSLDEPFLRDVEAFCDIEGIHLSTHENPLMAEVKVGKAAPEGFEPLFTSVGVKARRLGAKVFLTGQNGDLVMGNWFDDSAQIAASLRRFRFAQAYEEALAWSKRLRIPVLWVLWRGLRAALPASLTSTAKHTLADRSNGHKGIETSLLPGFCKRTGLFEKEGFFSRVWMEAPPERRKHFQELAMLLELRKLQAPEPLQNLDYTHPFAHRPLVEFLMTVPADVLCGPGEPRRLMRHALADILPPKVRSRRSKGFFHTPWFEVLRPMARELAKERQMEVVERGFVDRTSFVSRLEHLAAGIDSNEPQLRQIILLELWLRQCRLRRFPVAELCVA